MQTKSKNKAKEMQKKNEKKKDNKANASNTLENLRKTQATAPF